MTLRCRIVSSDYIDRDVLLNVWAFYAAAGCRLQSRGGADPDLLVVLRGDNGTAQRSFSGVVHIYDYVKEYRVDWAARYPAARSIVLINLDADPERPHDPRLRQVRAYLPVIPQLWARPAGRRRSRPVHVSNYKRMPGDAFQEQLLQLIQAGQVEVHGGRWELVGVRARPLSYRDANRLIASSASCFGLMWPYQRGTTLSGRMWQAPLNGCFVLSEVGTDPLGCPGVIELDRFDAASASRVFTPERCAQLAEEADRFWRQHTASLAEALGFDPAAQPSAALLLRLRGVLLLWDLEFRLQRRQEGLASHLLASRARLASVARRLGVHPRQWRERRRPPHQ